MSWLSSIPWQAYAVFIAIIACGLYLRWRRTKDRETTTRLIDSMLKNLEANRGIKPDAASIQWLSDHPDFAASMWNTLGMASFEIAQQKPSRRLRHELEVIIPYDEFKQRFPAAASVFDHVVEWCKPDE